jgi:UDPglucose--hexose-1-phosphate uridylyltransferase
MKNPLVGKWEKRWHPLREEWVVYSAHRNQRPWQGAPSVVPKHFPQYDPACYLCPGNPRVHGAINPHYQGVYIFENDHPVVSHTAPLIEPVTDEHLFYKKASARGVAKVVCYDPRHNITLSQMPLPKVVNVFEAFQKEMIGFAQDDRILSVLIFENKGEAVGVSNPHPHGQIYATDFPFKLVNQQIEIAAGYRKQFNRNIFENIIHAEITEGIRVVAENESAVAFIPFFARYAYEVMIFPKAHHASLITLSRTELAGLASAFHEVVRKLDMNYNMDFPYVMSLMQAPVDGKRYDEFRMHIWLQPPYRQPGLIKYLAGPEIGAGNFMADTMPEEKAAELRKINVKKYPHEHA